MAVYRAMRVVLQRVRRASVAVAGETVGAIGHGLVALVGVGARSTPGDAAWLAAKTDGLRIFADDAGHMNRCRLDVGGGVLAISQFTLYGDVRKGRRPSFVGAAEPAHGERCYTAYCEALRAPVARGVFGAHMVIDFVADGPVTLLLEREGGRVSPAIPA
ncbi:MAG TPA: D-aminoacyl-tRNA deacylase [Egibacteraceae bacterium]|jgi:D-aminoacyl-tRNA deacylase|nr:D-aminoacyl-tRNA deacylase [Egibacteraceae bacterium]